MLQHTYYVYVIEARDRAGRPVLYVGQSGKTPEARLREHRSACKRYCRSCRCRHYAPHAARLRYELFSRYNPVDTRPEAEQIERWLAAKLRKRGYRVIGGH